MNNKFLVFLPFLFSLFLFVFICFNFNSSVSLAESIEKDRFFFANSGKVAEELDSLDEMLSVRGKTDESLPDSFFYNKLNRALADIDLIKGEYNEQIAAKINNFSEKTVNHGKLALSRENLESSGAAESLKNDLKTLKELVNLAARQKLGVLKYSYFMWQDFLNKTVMVSSALFLIMTFIVTLTALKYGNRTNTLLNLIGLDKKAGIKEAAAAVKTLTEISAAEKEELGKKLAREQIVGKRKEDLLNTIPEGLMAAASGRVTFVNKAMKEWFGTELSAIGDDVESILKKVCINLHEGKFSNGGETYMLDIFESQNETFYMFRNITKSEELSSRLLNSERLASIGEMAARITHEIRNPLHTIKLNSTYLVENVDKIESNSKKELLSLVVHEVERLEQITEKYMGMVNYNKKSPEETGVSIPADLTEFLSFHQPELQKRGIELSLENNEQLTMAILPDSFKEIMLNLLKNAWEELENCGKIKISVKHTGNFAIISVEDSGRGVPQKERETIFKNFYTKKPGGTGIGLSHSRKLATEAGGKLYVEDSALGGAAFILEIPLKKKS